MTHLLVLVLAADAMANVGDIKNDVIEAAIDFLAIILMGWLGLLCAFQEVHWLLFDILLEEEVMPLTFTRAKNLRINDLLDMATLKMTHFNWCQLKGL